MRGRRHRIWLTNPAVTRIVGVALVLEGLADAVNLIVVAPVREAEELVLEDPGATELAAETASSPLRISPIRSTFESILLCSGLTAMAVDPERFSSETRAVPTPASSIKILCGLCAWACAIARDRSVG